MKKIIAAVAMLAASVALASAEIAVGARGIFQIGAGSSISDEVKGYYKAQGVDADSTVGLGGGFAAFAHIPIPAVEGLAVQPEIGFTHNSIGMEVSAMGQKSDGSISCNTLNIPVLLAYDIKATDGVTVSPFAGPQLGILLGDLTTDSNGSSKDYKVDTSILFGIVIGAAAAIDAGPGSFVVDARYDIGLNAVKSKASAGFSSMELATFRGIQLSAGYQIKF